MTIYRGLSFAVILFCLCFAQLAQGVEKNVLAINGIAEMEIVPDVLQLTVVLTESGTELAKVEAVINERIRRLFVQTNSLSIERSAITTSQFYISPPASSPSIQLSTPLVQSIQNDDDKNVHLFVNNATQSATLGALTLNRLVYIQLQNMSQYSSLLFLLNKMNLNQNSELTYRVNNIAETYQTTLLMAIENAKTKATVIAKANQLTLGHITNIIENSVQPESKKVSENLNRAFSAKNGNQVIINAAVRVEFEIKP